MDFQPLNLNTIDYAATEAARQLAETGFAHVDLTPGDLTLYPISILAPTHRRIRTSSAIEGTRDYLVSLACSFGRGYPWAGPSIGMLHWTYAASKWANDDPHAGYVMAMFLNALSAAIAETTTTPLQS